MTPSITKLVDDRIALERPVTEWDEAKLRTVLVQIIMERDAWWRESGFATKPCKNCGNCDCEEFMHNKPEGYYCETCYQDIFG